MLCATAIQTLAVHLPKLLRVSAQTRCVELPFLGVCTGERQRPSSTDHQALEGVDPLSGVGEVRGGNPKLRKSIDS